MTPDGPGSTLRTNSGVASAVVGALILIVVVVGLVAACSGFSRAGAGEVGVVRNGGPFDDRNIRQVLPPGSGLTWTGMLSSKHFYPASTVQRYYTITADASHGDRLGVDVVSVQTSDGFLVGIEGTFYFTTAFDDTSEGKQLAASFDQQFGTRKFGSVAKSPWQGDEGWNAYLDTIVRPIIDNELRQAVLKFDCKELISSCALVASRGNVQAIQSQGAQTNVNLARVQDEVQSGFQTDVRATLGDNYFRNIRFRLVRVTLPDQVQAAIHEAQAAFAQVGQAQARVLSAKREALANRIRQQGYRQCPACADIDKIKALPSGANVFFGVNPVVATGSAR